MLSLILVLGLATSALAGGLGYQGSYGGKCGNDGFYYLDGRSFMICSNGNSYRQPCAPGSRNSGSGGYGSGAGYYAHNLCNVNLVDAGYTIRHGGYGGQNRGYGAGGHSAGGYNGGYNGGYAAGGHSGGYNAGGHSAGGYSGGHSGGYAAGGHSGGYNVGGYNAGGYGSSHSAGYGRQQSGYGYGQPAKPFGIGAGKGFVGGQGHSGGASYH